MKLLLGIMQTFGTTSKKRGLQILVAFLLIIALAGGDPKPQQNVRVVPISHATNTQYRARQKEYPHHMRRDHQQFRNKDRKGIQKQKPKQEDRFRLWKEGPNFDTDLRQHVYAQEGQTAVLTCRVYDRGNKTVSWIRHHDLHILTVGRYTYTADMRFHSRYNANKDEWRLEVHSVQKHDSGRYECQVNTQPVRSFFVQLNVVDALPLGKGSSMIINDGPLSSSSIKGSNQDSNLDISRNQRPQTKATILGDKDVYIDVRSPLNLTCNVRQIDSRALYPNDPHFIIWRRNNETIDYDENDGSKDNRYTVTTNTNDLEQCTSHLIIHSVEPSDDGKYTCHPSAPSRDASVRVHIVIDGEQKAAIRTNGASKAYFGAFAGKLAQSVTSHTNIVFGIYDLTVIANTGTRYLTLLLVVILPTMLYTTQFNSISLQRL